MLLTANQFLTGALENALPQNPSFRVRSGYLANAEERDPENRTHRFLLSTPIVNRNLFHFVMSGAHLDGYKRNPIVLWNHDRNGLPIATGNVWVDSNLWGDAAFAPANINTFAERVHQHLNGGFLHACSTGVLPIDWEVIYNEEGEFQHVRFLEWELLEFSVVTVPADPLALKKSSCQPAAKPETTNTAAAARDRELQILRLRAGKGVTP